MLIFIPISMFVLFGFSLGLTFAEREFIKVLKQRISSEDAMANYAQQQAGQMTFGRRVDFTPDESRLLVLYDTQRKNHIHAMEVLSVVEKVLKSRRLTTRLWGFIRR